MFFLFKRFKNGELDHIGAENASNRKVADSRLHPYTANGSEWSYEIVFESPDWIAVRDNIRELRDN